MARRPHRDGDGRRLLAGAGGPDLEGLFADDPVTAELDGPPANGDDAGRGDVTGGRRGPVHPASVA